MLINTAKTTFNTPLSKPVQTPDEQLKNYIKIGSIDSINLAIELVKTHFSDQKELLSLLEALQPIVANTRSGLSEKIEAKTTILQYINQNLGNSNLK